MKESECLIKCLRSDRGGEYTSTEFNEFCSTNGIKTQLTTAYTPQQNGVSERKNRTLMNMVRSMLLARQVPKVFWPKAAVWATHVLNRSPTLSVKDMTLEEAWSGVKPSVQHFRIFGYFSYVHVPDSQRKKLDDKSFKCILLGLSEESKGYKLYDPKGKKVVISRDVVFEESQGWNWNDSENTQSSSYLIDNDVIEFTADEPLNQTDTEVPQLDDISEVNSSDHDNVVSNHEEEVEIESPEERELSPRTRNPPGYLKDYITGREAEENDLQSGLAMFNTSIDPITFDEASKLKVWREAMKQENEAIESNNTCELTDLPAGSKKIGVKWIYKTKLNEKGEIEKYKARLVAKGYA